MADIVNMPLKRTNPVIMPAADHLLVKQTTEEESRISGIVIPKTVANPNNAVIEGEIIRVPNDCSYSVGQHVMFAPYALKMIQVGSRDFGLIPISAVIAVVEWE